MEDIQSSFFQKPKDPISFNQVRISLASPDRIRAWSHGEVKKPETINYRTFKPERDGLFCAKIFGPTKDYECNCGKYKRMKHRGVVCEKCGVEVIQSKVRRERMGHIELASPVAHIWFLKSLPSKMGNLLDITLKDMEKVLYFESYLILDPKDTSLLAGQVLTEEAHRQAIDQWGEGAFVSGIGAEAVKEMIKNLDIALLSVKLRDELSTTTSEAKRKKLVKRLRIVESFRDSGNDPAWMILEVIPVLPPDLRPLVPLEGGRFATSDLNDLYRRVINRNNRLKRLMELSAPEIIIRNEKRMLQEAVDVLFDNGRRGKTITGPNKRPLKSLSDMLKGKQGRFRQNLLGKRVDYSGRSVIVIGPDLRLHQCGLPKKMALELFKPFIYHQLEKKGLTSTIKAAKKLVEKETSEVWDTLSEVVREYPILLNRAPTLHRLGIQAFEPILIEGKAIQLHPLVCAAFNADFDGDQMAVHVPLSIESQIEARVLMMSTNNILSPANGEPVIVPSQDIVLGLYYMTKEKPGAKGEGRLFASPGEVRMAFDAEALELQARIDVRLGGRKETTTCGRVLLYEIIPDEIPFAEVNKVMNKNELRNLIAKCYRVCGTKDTVILTDHLKDLGYQFATRAGISLCISNMIIPESKNQIIETAQAEITVVDGQYKEGLITEGEKYNKVVDIWTRASNEVAERMMREIQVTKLDGQPAESQGAPGFNPIFMMADSGARGSKDQMRQLAGMRGLMAKPTGEIIEQPITANFREGLTVLQYFVSTHGARKGLADTALKTANSGYLTRRLVDVAQDSIILEKDCGTLDGIEIEALRDAGEIRQTLNERILGRTALFDIVSPVDDSVLVAAGEEIGEDEAEAIEKSGLTKILIRSVLTCRALKGVCAKCYGRDLAHGKLVEIGESIGIIAAQSIGEPGTQLTMRTFHIGGTASRRAEKNVISTELKGAIEFSPDVRLVRTLNDELVVMSRKGEIVIRDENNLPREKHDLIYGAHLKLKPKPALEALPLIPAEELDLAGIAPYVKELDAAAADLERAAQAGDKAELARRSREIAPLVARLKAFAVANGYLTPAGGVLDAARDAPQLASLARLWPQIQETINASERVLSEYELKQPEEASRLGRDFELTLRESGEFVEWDPFTQPILTEVTGYVSFEDMEEGKTMVEKVDAVTGKSSKVIVESKLLDQRPCIKVVGETGAILKNSKGSGAVYQLPVNAILMVEEKAYVRAGDALAKIPRETTKTKDITGGLPRVAELFEVRKPKEVAVISEIDGVISFGRITKGKRKILVTPEFGEPKEYLIPKGKHVTVHEGDYIRAGEALMDGSANPHDILSIRGVKDLAKYLVDEVQQVYRLQSVKINDKHIEVIVRQMLRKVRVKTPGDTEFLVGESVDRLRFEEINAAIAEAGQEPATAEPLLQGITKASLSTESFISAASFQETTKVLTEAAVAGKVDSLAGLKENVIMGRLIPAGTGLLRYQYSLAPDLENELMSDGVGAGVSAGPPAGPPVGAGGNGGGAGLRLVK
ncbi:MAG: DNA-directed RNA polymerase subunit beta' [Deltaproteobacteria bacterium]|jgi:DNA-directed RNA polymerase subunit beta'|nr:DNA-directed RNA polymerase subunit beta' [Deltaproteobacteria bacterium]